MTQSNNNRGNQRPNPRGNTRSNLNSGSPNANTANSNQNANNRKRDFSQRKESNPRSNFPKSDRSEFHKKPTQRMNTDSVVSRIANPKREESLDDIKMDIEKLDKDIQFEIKQIHSIKLGI